MRSARPVRTSSVKNLLAKAALRGFRSSHYVPRRRFFHCASPPRPRAAQAIVFRNRLRNSRSQRRDLLCPRTAPASAGDSLLPPKSRPRTPKDNTCQPLSSRHAIILTMTSSPTLTIALPGGIRPAPICIHYSACDEEMEEKENVNQNPKISEFSIQNGVCSVLCSVLFSRSRESAVLESTIISIAVKNKD